MLLSVDNAFYINANPVIPAYLSAVIGRVPVFGTMLIAFKFTRGGICCCIRLQSDKID